MKERDLLINVFEFDDLIVGLRSDGIIHTYIKSEAVVNRQMQENIINSVIALKAGDSKKYPALVEFGEFISISDDVIPHTNLAFKEHILSVVMYAKNVADRILAKYYSRKYKTSSQFIIFNQFDEAIEYSYEQMRKTGMIIL